MTIHDTTKYPLNPCAFITVRIPFQVYAEAKEYKINMSAAARDGLFSEINRAKATHAESI